MHVEKHLQRLFTVGLTCSYVQEELLNTSSPIKMLLQFFSHLNTHIHRELPFGVSLELAAEVTKLFMYQANQELGPYFPRARKRGNCNVEVEPG